MYPLAPIAIRELREENRRERIEEGREGESRRERGREISCFLLNNIPQTLYNHERIISCKFAISLNSK